MYPLPRPAGHMGSIDELSGLSCLSARSFKIYFFSSKIIATLARMDIFPSAIVSEISLDPP
jgi:hypothetical protein